MEFTAELIASMIGGEIAGDPLAKVTTISKIEEGTPGALSFLSNPKYEQFLYTSQASIVIVNKSLIPSRPVKATMIRVDDAYACFAKILEMYAGMNKKQRKGISSLAVVPQSSPLPEDSYVGAYTVIGEDLRIGPGALIYPQVYVGDNVTIGYNVTLYPGVRIMDGCVIGNNVIINSGCVIGADGFGFAPNPDNTYSKIPQLGNVLIEDDVEIGANTCIDRATMGSTIIRRGVKLDNLIQLGHNVTIGKNSVIAAQAGVAGSSKLGDNCMVGGQVGIAGHLNIGNGVKLGSKAGISNNIPDGELHMGNPSMPGSKFHRSYAVFRNLPDLSAKVRKLESEIKRLTELLESGK